MNEVELRYHIDKISNYSSLRNSKRSISFLKYICTCCLEGKENHIKEYSIGVDAFGLQPTFDPQIDPRVRVEASRLRKRLAEYYKEDGQDDLVRIVIPRGSYIPEFHRVDEEARLASYSQFIIDGRSVRVFHPVLIYQSRYSLLNYSLSTLLNTFFLFTEEIIRQEHNGIDIELNVSVNTEELHISAIFSEQTIFQAININEEDWKEDIKAVSVPLVEQIIRDWINPDLRRDGES